MPGDLPNDYRSFRDSGTEGPQDSVLCQYILLRHLSDCCTNAPEVLLGSDHCSEGNGSIVIMWLKENIQPRIRAQSEILKTKLLMISFAGKRLTISAVNNRQFFMLNIAAILN